MTSRFVGVASCPLELAFNRRLLLIVGCAYRVVQTVCDENDSLISVIYLVCV